MRVTVQQPALQRDERLTCIADSATFSVTLAVW
jgi:hypothetical protein